MRQPYASRSPGDRSGLVPMPLHWCHQRPAEKIARMIELPAGFRAHVGNIGIKDDTDDFLLLSPGELAEHEAAFDRWWASYRAGSSG